ncbi:hypothetical protein L1987_58489 [Smallanthus sonchifolius]|uniref:Uncharacterized protein n=1 Tax=Smallanthus sonchifolius TaxID=185202 RepID=A0ACB9DFW8_9ASTR|nr:hypothetical protein L1987_58489 [Smallanthus sonchifolius]
MHRNEVHKGILYNCTTWMRAGQLVWSSFLYNCTRRFCTVVQLGSASLHSCTTIHGDFVQLYNLDQLADQLGPVQPYRMILYSCTNPSSARFLLFLL